ncbi:16S rRNA (cytidine(1402)-2'-O)-methyltransferase [Consotaella salsifontis]|uniref:Ribosomal RNA small subunit methyltransferase I n=1 Tax=Consotaella salsifontis TaxID=1365950 RepID=A0A1T4QQM8_9HYPH|nr:16S rRNA (cytidine(1402)-2'-O)-methyltransferase [Consotaella salsifontis]SKA05568.1 16S rRNA (cytidine1402-2'-O)-methyltransferase [Consotaella salsifontis]
MDEAEAGSFKIRDARFAATKPEPGLYLVATPIGNLSDITLRALQIIAGADRLVCEDTRVTAKLLARFGIERRMSPYHEHNAARAGEALIEALERGESIALVSDAGTPLVSDPGERLAKAAIERGIPVFPVPGASAALAALLVSGLPAESFFFAGFLPPKEAARRTRLEELCRIPATLLLYEAPHRIAESLADMARVLGDERRASVCRELTKAHETVYRGELSALAGEFSAMESIKGEIVVVVAPPAAEAAASAEDADAILAGLLAEMKPTKAAQEAARLTGLSRRDLYARALAMKSES